MKMLQLHSKTIVVFLIVLIQIVHITQCVDPIVAAKTDVVPIKPVAAKSAKLTDDPNLEDRFGYSYAVGNEKGYGYPRRPAYTPGVQVGAEENPNRFNPMNNYGPQTFVPQNGHNIPLGMNGQNIPNVQNGYGGIPYGPGQGLGQGVGQGGGIGSYGTYGGYGQPSYGYGEPRPRPNVYGEKPKLQPDFEGQYGPPRNYGERGNGYGYGNNYHHDSRRPYGNGYGYYNHGNHGENNKEGQGVNDLPPEYIRMGGDNGDQNMDYGNSPKEYSRDQYGDSPYYWNKK